jgi:Uracil phosphoribosyltransferase
MDLIDSAKLIICAGFLWLVMPCTLAFDSLNGCGCSYPCYCEYCGRGGGPAEGTRGKGIRLVCLISAPQGIDRMRGAHPDIRIWTAAIDESLDERAFIVPGLGDAGDRAYGTK